MNGDAEDLPLREIGDEDILLLATICRRAAESNAHNKPLKALWDAYREELEEQGIDTSHDNVLYNYIWRISDNAARTRRAVGDVNYNEELRQVLDGVGIVLVDHDQDGADEVTRDVPVPAPAHETRVQHKVDRRRVSFDDARLEETRLSERTETAEERPELPQGLLRRPPLRARPLDNTGRARSTSGQRHVSDRQPASNGYVQTSHSSLYPSDPDGPGDSSMLLRISERERQRDERLEEYLEAFLATDEIRLQRRCMHKWHDATVVLRARDTQAYAIATAHDARILSRQTLDTLLQAMQLKRAKRKHEADMLYFENKATRVRGLMLMRKCLDQMYQEHLEQKKLTLKGRFLLLTQRYFRLWKGLAVDNATKSRSILLRKTLRIWQERTDRRWLVNEQATAHHEETVQKKLLSQWLFRSRSERVTVSRENRIKRNLFNVWVQKARHDRDLRDQAQDHRSRHLATIGFAALRVRLEGWQQAAASAEAHLRCAIKKTSFQTLRIQGRLKPLETTMTLRVNLTLERKAFAIWHLNLGLTRQAHATDRERVIRDAWTNWNDALRCRALAQRIDERVLVENLYRWVLQERLRIFQRTRDGRFLQRCLLSMRGTSDNLQLSLEDRAARFAQGQRRRKLVLGMQRLNVAMRQREDADRAAVEFVNSKILPDVFDTWKLQTEHARQLARWAADARFYCLSKSTLKRWHERTIEHQHQRRRGAYVQIRARIKLRVVGECFVQWRSKCMEVHSMNGEGERRARAKSLALSTHIITHWQDLVRRYQDDSIEATRIDQRRLISSALSTVLARQDQLATLDQTATTFRRDTDLALEATALKRLQWATFTASQHTKSAAALLARNRDQHSKHMLRHWSAKAALSRAAKTQEPESPSLRPASRAAARSQSRDRFASPSRTATQGTPAYMRTPSRSRRAGRFRPIPTPVPHTPFAFESAYLTTTPAPLQWISDASPPGQQSVVGLTPQVTPFARKLRAGGFSESVPPSALRGSVFGRSVLGGGTAKSVRFAGASRFRQVVTATSGGEGEDDEDGGGVGLKSSS